MSEPIIVGHEPGCRCSGCNWLRPAPVPPSHEHATHTEPHPCCHKCPPVTAPKPAKRGGSSSGFKCQECGHKFRTVKAAERAAFGDNGCPKCGGSDIDLG